VVAALLDQLKKKTNEGASLENQVDALADALDAVEFECEDLFKRNFHKINKISRLTADLYAERKFLLPCCSIHLKSIP